MKITKRACKSCKTEFRARRSDAKYCSGACKQNAYLDRIKNFVVPLEPEKPFQKNRLTERINELDRQLTELLKNKNL